MLAFLCCCCPCGPCKKCNRGCPQCGDGKCCYFEKDGSSDYVEKHSVRPPSGGDLEQIQQVRNIDSTTGGDFRSFTADPSVITGQPSSLYKRQREIAEIEQKKEKERQKNQNNQKQTEVVVELNQNKENSPYKTDSRVLKCSSSYYGRARFQSGPVW